MSVDSFCKRSCRHINCLDGDYIRTEWAI